LSHAISAIPVSDRNSFVVSYLAPAALAAVTVATVLSWLTWAGRGDVQPRLPGTDRAPEGDGAGGANPVLAGRIIRGEAQPAALEGSWSGFRGTDRSGISVEKTALARIWGPTGPRELWSVDGGEGYGGAAVSGGRVYLMDYDRAGRQSALRCLSLADGGEICGGNARA